MKLYIESDITFHVDSLLDVAELDGQLKFCSVGYKQDGLNITLLPQKITLDEYMMNDLLESLSYFVQFKLRARQNGYGLEMSLYLEEIVTV
jgi:hypothetical protein